MSALTNDDAQDEELMTTRRVMVWSQLRNEAEHVVDGIGDGMSEGEVPLLSRVNRVDGWYSALLVLAIVHERGGLWRRVVSVRLIRASSFEEAFARALVLGRAAE